MYVRDRSGHTNLIDALHAAEGRQGSTRGKENARHTERRPEPPPRGPRANKERAYRLHPVARSVPCRLRHRMVTGPAEGTFIGHARPQTGLVVHMCTFGPAIPSTRRPLVQRPSIFGTLRGRRRVAIPHPEVCACVVR